MSSREYARKRREAWVDQGTCIFPNDHAPGHPEDMRFHVHFDQAADWEELTEAEMLEKYGYEEDGERYLPGFLHSSQWDFWYAP